MERSRITNEVNHENKRCSKQYWTNEEDEILLQLIQQQGARNWSSIAWHLQGRTGQSCRWRWINHLNPIINKNPLGKCEEEKLLRLTRIYGNKWTGMTRFFPGRTAHQLRTRFYNLKLSRLDQQIFESGQNQHHSANLSHGITLSHVIEKIDLNYPPYSTFGHLSNGLDLSCIPPILRPSDQSRSGVEDQMSHEFNAPKVSSLSRGGVDHAERFIHGEQTDIQGSSNGQSIGSDLVPVPNCKDNVFYDFLGMNE